jgi:hypothetical protein
MRKSYAMKNVVAFDTVIAIGKQTTDSGEKMADHYSKRSAFARCISVIRQLIRAPSGDV